MPYAVVNLKIEYVSDKDRKAIERKVIDFAKAINKRSEEEVWLSSRQFKKKYELTKEQMRYIREKNPGIFRQTSTRSFIYNETLYINNNLKPPS
jgi:hypothetical protein